MPALELSVFDDETLAALANGAALPADMSALETYEKQFQDDVLPKGLGFGPRDYWKALKLEFHTLVCGASKGEADSYKDLRKVIDKHGSKSQLAIVSSIAAFIGAQIGLEAAILVPWIAIFLGVVRKVGVEAFCRAMQEELKQKSG
ncbi:MAG: hypothetical protein CMJ42_10320 [Phyllobacteriaceae bacterium]|nr:hypothetical protein [Phyllobacteriaceae bacterium]MBA89146.1 hypothetical protein [Phyllobacteriaceae bacterium]